MDGISGSRDVCVASDVVIRPGTVVCVCMGLFRGLYCSKFKFRDCVTVKYYGLTTKIRQNHPFWALEGTTGQTKETLAGSKVAHNPANTFSIIFIPFFVEQFKFEVA